VLLYHSIGKSCYKGFRKLWRRPCHTGECLSSRCWIVGEQKRKCQTKKWKSFRTGGAGNTLPTTAL